MNTDREAELTQGFQVQADDNFLFLREDERWVLGNFATYEEALSTAILNGSSHGPSTDAQNPLGKESKY